MGYDDAPTLPPTPYEELGEISAAVARIHAGRLRNEPSYEADGRQWLSELRPVRDIMRDALGTDPALRGGFIPLPPGLGHERTAEEHERTRCTILAALLLPALLLLEMPESLDGASGPGYALNAGIMAMATLTGVDS